jgi:hypothetical protein
MLVSIPEVLTADEGQATQRAAESNDFLFPELVGRRTWVENSGILSRTSRITLRAAWVCKNALEYTSEEKRLARMTSTVSSTCSVWPFYTFPRRMTARGMTRVRRIAYTTNLWLR